MQLAMFAADVGAALLMGMVIGLERQYRHHPAGLRTNALVCLGAALFVSVGRLFDTESSPTRIAAQVVSGIGFLGAGVILREGLNVRGLNTAATLWCSGAIGTLAGLGLLVEGAIGTVAVLLANVALRPLVLNIDARLKTAVDVDTLYRVRVVCPTADEGVIRAIFTRHVNSHPTMNLQGLSILDAGQPGKTAVVAEIFSSERDDRYMNELVSRISVEPCIAAVSWERVR